MFQNCVSDDLIPFLFRKQKINLSELEDGNDGVGIVLVDADSGGAIENPFNDINKLPYDVVSYLFELEKLI